MNGNILGTIAGWIVGIIGLAYAALEFVPSMRLAYNKNKTWAFSAEEYADYGIVSDFLPASEQQHQLFGVVNYSGKIDVEAGVGVGLNSASDRLTFKLLLSKDLTKFWGR